MPINIIDATGTTQTVNTLPSLGAAEALSSLPVVLTLIKPEAWTIPSTAWDVRDYGDVEIQFVTTPGTAYQPQRSLNGTNYVNCLAYDEAGNSYNTITVAGIYSFNGNGYLKFSTGAGSTLTRRAAA